MITKKQIILEEAKYCFKFLFGKDDISKQMEKQAARYQVLDATLKEYADQPGVTKPQTTQIEVARSHLLEKKTIEARTKLRGIGFFMK